MRKLIAGFMALSMLFLMGTANAAITTGNSSKISSTSGNSSPVTTSWLHDNNKSANNVVVVSTGIFSSTYNITGVTYNGVAMTSARTVSVGASEQLWYLVDATSGNNQVVVSYGTASQQRLRLGTALTLNGVNQSSPVGVNAGASAVSTTTSLNITGASSSLIVSGLTAESTSPLTLTASQGTTHQTASDLPTAISSVAATGSSQSIAWTSSSSIRLVLAAVEFKVAVSVPTVTTQAVSGIGKTTATLNGNITATGGENATVRGFYYKVGTTGDPTAGDTVISSGGSFGTGAYTEVPTTLLPGTSYRVAAFATNSAGTSTGTTVGFTTDAEASNAIFFGSGF